VTVLPAPIVLEHTTTPLSFDAGEITFIGTATVLVRYAGFTVLTDPNFLHKEIGPMWAWASRRAA